MAVVGNADVDDATGQRGRRGNLDPGASIGAGQDLDIAHPRAGHAGRHRLADRLLRRPPTGPPLGAVGAVRDLPLAQELAQEARAELLIGRRNPLDRRDVNSDSRRHRPTRR